MASSRVPSNSVDHVGSLKRPPELVAAWREWEAGKLPPEKLREVQDESDPRSRRDAGGLGLPIVTDGEFRRGGWSRGFLNAVEGFEFRASKLVFRNDEGFTTPSPAPMATKKSAAPDRLSPRTSSSSHPSRRTASRSRCRRRRTCTSASSRMPSIRTVYPDVEAYWDDMVAVFQQEINELYAAGCRYLQLDEVPLALLCDNNIRALAKSEGDDPDKLVGALYRRSQPRDRRPARRHDDRHASMPRQHGKPVDGRWRLCADRRGPVQPLRRRRLSAGIRLPARRRFRAAAASAGRQARLSRNHQHQKPGAWNRRTNCCAASTRRPATRRWSGSASARNAALPAPRCRNSPSCRARSRPTFRPSRSSCWSTSAAAPGATCDAGARPNWTATGCSRRSGPESLPVLQGACANASQCIGRKRRRPGTSRAITTSIELQDRPDLSVDRIETLYSYLPRTNPERFSDIVEHYHRWLLYRDDAYHDRLKALFLKAMTPRAVERLRPMMQRRVDVHARRVGEARRVRRLSRFRRADSDPGDARSSRPAGFRREH